MNEKERIFWSKNFILLMSGQIISVFGSAILRFALSLYILDLTGREDLFAALYAISNVPLIFAPIGGALADRFNRRNLMVMWDFISCFIVLCFSIFCLFSTSIVIIGLTMTLLSIPSAMETPTVSACIPLVVKKQFLEKGNGVIQAVQALSAVIAPVLGGALYALTEIKLLVGMSCVAFFIAAILEIFIKIPFTQQKCPFKVKSILVPMRDGVRYIVKTPFIIKSMILAAFFNIIVTPILVVGTPILLKVTLQSTDTMYGFGMGIIEFASILGALIIGSISTRLHIKTLYRWLLIITGLLVPQALSVTPFIIQSNKNLSYILFISFSFLIAMIMSILSIFLIVKVQKKTDEKKLGTVMAIIIATTQCAAPIGQILYGILFQRFQHITYVPILFAGVIMFIISLTAYRLLQKETD